MFDKRRKLKYKIDQDSKRELDDVEKQLAEKYAEEMKNLNCYEGGMNAGRLWKLRKKLCPYKENPPTAMLDTSGNTISSESNLKEHTINHKVLENRVIKPGLESLQAAKENLHKERIDLAKIKKSEPWTKEDLETVLKHLKKNKSRDPNNHANEIFHIEAAGKDLMHALLVIMNKIKEQLCHPQAYIFNLQKGQKK